MILNQHPRRSAVRSGAAADALIICASHSPRKNKHPTESEEKGLCYARAGGKPRNRSTYCKTVFYVVRKRPTARDDDNARERVCIQIDDESRRADRVAAHRGKDRSALSKQNALVGGHNDIQKVSVKGTYCRCIAVDRDSSSVSISARVGTPRHHISKKAW